MVYRGQIVPTVLGKLLNQSDPEKSKKVMEAMLKMNKLDINGLQQAVLLTQGDRKKKSLQMSKARRFMRRIHAGRTQCEHRKLQPSQT